jgi:hypothetical protein
MTDAIERELAWLESLVAKYGVDPARQFELYLEISRHFRTKREHEKAEREARRWERVQRHLRPAPAA